MLFVMNLRSVYHLQTATMNEGHFHVEWHGVLPIQKGIQSVLDLDVWRSTERVQCAGYMSSEQEREQKDERNQTAPHSNLNVPQREGNAVWRKAAHHSETSSMQCASAGSIPCTNHNHTICPADTWWSWLRLLISMHHHLNGRTKSNMHMSCIGQNQMGSEAMKMNCAQY